MSGIIHMSENSVHSFKYVWILLYFVEVVFVPMRRRHSCLVSELPYRLFAIESLFVEHRNRPLSTNIAVFVIDNVVGVTTERTYSFNGRSGLFPLVSFGFSITNERFELNEMRAFIS
jgi:hypothetical protein